ncbi:hypothetical protein [Paracidovorax cattleyae]|uniref:hypothetical protein n=1 Tax=Paracidovorax cattleyae TaxID=80868 RepID=UPI0018AFC7FE|nr:hypothetical protein [Paracidovorax cattleyae]MBF9265225.1 hypothetical protein [Paracidovorax cattleyae]
MAEAFDIFFRWTGITFWCVAVGAPSWLFLRAFVELADYLRWLRHIYGPKRATWQSLVRFGWCRRGDFLPFGRSFLLSPLDVFPGMACATGAKKGIFK